MKYFSSERNSPSGGMNAAGPPDADAPAGCDGLQPHDDKPYSYFVVSETSGPLGLKIEGGMDSPKAKKFWKNKENISIIVKDNNNGKLLLRDSPYVRARKKVRASEPT